MDKSKSLSGLWIALLIVACLMELVAVWVDLLAIGERNVAGSSILCIIIMLSGMLSVCVGSMSVCSLIIGNLIVCSMSVGSMICELSIVGIRCPQNDIVAIACIRSIYGNIFIRINVIIIKC